MHHLHHQLKNLASFALPTLQSTPNFATFAPPLCSSPPPNFKFPLPQNTHPAASPPTPPNTHFVRWPDLQPSLRLAFVILFVALATLRLVWEFSHTYALIARMSHSRAPTRSTHAGYLILQILKPFKCQASLPFSLVKKYRTEPFIARLSIILALLKRPFNFFVQNHLILKSLEQCLDGVLHWCDLLSTWDYFCTVEVWKSKIENEQLAIFDYGYQSKTKSMHLLSNVWELASRLEVFVCPSDMQLPYRPSASHLEQLHWKNQWLILRRFFPSNSIGFH